MLLSDRDIRAEIDAGRVASSPYDEAMVQPSSIDVRLDRFFRLFDNHKYPFIDPAEDQPDLTRLVEVDAGRAVHPAPRRVRARLDVRGRHAARRRRRPARGQVSSLGRLGLLTHSTAGFIDPGFSGHVTLELSNVATLPIKLWPGMKIGQLCFFRLSARRPSTRTARRSTARATRASAARRPAASFQNFHRTEV